MLTIESGSLPRKTANTVYKRHGERHNQVGLLGILTETGIQNENELTQIKNWCTKQSISMTAIYVDEAISHAITEARKHEKDPATEYNKSTSYRRGGVLIFWTRPFPIHATKIELDTTLHWIKVTFTNNQENFAVIGLYNNQQNSTLSNHDYDKWDGNTILEQDIIPRLHDQHTILVGDLNQTVDDHKYRYPAPKNISKSIVKQIITEHKMTDAMQAQGETFIPNFCKTCY